MAKSPYFRRPKYAEAIKDALLNPGPLDAGILSGLFLSGIRRVGKTTFIKQDLIPAIEADGAIAIYVDLWADKAKNSTDLVTETVKVVAHQLATPGSGILGRLKGLNLGAVGFSFGFQIDSIGANNGATLGQVFQEITDLAHTDVVLIIDEVQQAMATDEGNNLLHALKAARDQVNLNPRRSGRLLIVGTGSHKSLVADMTSRRTQPFAGAMYQDYAPLGDDFVEWIHQAMTAAPGYKIPDLAVMQEGFRTMGNRPEELLQAVNILQSHEHDPNVAFPIICSTKAATAANAEIANMEGLGELALVIFDKIASGSPNGVKNLYSADALAEYSKAIGSPVDSGQVQGMTNRMVELNFIQRLGHGTFIPADPLVSKAWLANKALQAMPKP
ncbi:MAG: ATP-binding protein [Pusillimonas sp.]